MERVSDWTGRFSGVASEVVRPVSEAEVAAVLREGRAVTTRGGNTSLVGGATPATRRPTVLLEASRLNQFGPVDTDAGQVIVGAGVTLGELQAHLAGSGWAFGVDLAARGSATLGGMAATNAGGIRVIRYGMMRAQVMGVRAVLADGSVIDETAGLLKNNTGYWLSSLLVGSEGTLGIITAVRVRLHPAPPASCSALLPIQTLAEGQRRVGALRRAGADLLAAEVIDDAGARLVGGMPIGGAPWYLLVEVAGPPEALGLLDAEVLATSAVEHRRLWAVREGQTEAWGRAASQAGTVVQKFDVSLPSGQLDAFSASVRGLGPQVGIFGHLADGNLHLEIIDPEREWDAEVLGLVAAVGGSISAEHGIGQAKRDYLHLTRSAAEIAAMRRIKQALDPRWILNPGVLLADDGAKGPADRR